MKSRFGEKNKLLIRLFKIIPILLFLLNSLLVFSYIQHITIVTASENGTEWSVTLNFNESGGASNILIFGEAFDALDGQDSYDIPVPPPGIPPYIRTWFDAGLIEPYNTLYYDIRNYPDDSKIWNLYIQWVPSDYITSNDIIISWDIYEITQSGYESVVLFDYENDMIVADMLINDFYIYEYSAMKQYHFQIICNSTSTPNNPPNKPNNPSPQDGATDVSVDTILQWTGGDIDEEDEVSYDVYFGTTSFPLKVSSNQSSISYDTGILNYNTKYYWRIVSWDNHGLSNEGLIWHFTTIPQIPPTKNISPTAVLKAPKKGYINQKITFDASGSNDSDGYVQYYRWDFTNNGKWDTNWIEEAVITYIYTNSGNYSVRLQIKDNGGSTDTATTIITILSLEDEKFVPNAISNGPYFGIINQNITFDGSDSYDPDGTISNYTWDFGDTKKSGKITNHIYQTSGTYSVFLTVVDNDGLIDIDETNVYVNNNDSDEDGWGDEEEKKYGSDPDNSEDFPIDTDNDHIPDEIDVNDDNDGLSDTLEEKLGSDPKNKSDVLGIEINNVIHFLIDTNNDGKSEIFYNSRNGNTTEIKYKGDFKYLIDENGDGKWDYIYDFSLGTVSVYKEDRLNPFQLEQIIIILLICFLIIIVVIWFFRKKD